ncbi:MAG: carbonic anhydrase [Gemmatimonadota bacterium]
MPQRLIEGLTRFNREHFPRFKDHYQRLISEGQQPTTLFIGCSDSRLVPTLLTDALPGELFVVRNVGNFVPPFESDDGFHGTSAAIEFALVVLGVTDIVVCGHSDCGAIAALYRPPNRATPHVSKWLQLGREAMLEGAVNRELLRRTEQRSIALQIERLMTFPIVRERVERNEVSLHGWYYVIEEGRVYFLDVDTGSFTAEAAS